MVQINLASALAALACLSVAAAVPTPEEKPEGKVTTASRTKAEGLELAKINNEKRSVAGLDAELDERQVPSFGAYWENWDFQGAVFYHRANIDGRGYYIGDDWNDRISSIWNYDYDKQCSYWTQWDSANGGYCWGDGIILDGRTSYAQLYAPYNDAISCRECSWS